ncbi:hypothetical protein ACTI_35640 [Actinoplanes sp. OR16]|uniref:GNAT family N-acetyltransferase n=1 Tax=Actinoplanes sp. OR16 TaxID=946334 RepID=UPI000F6BA79F|nr:GNAT family N-acetyltransferase [Actinoplanes sp. OR16]BBH66879.1 hypothetical protein ACTI_35640 [Actinoplanes sp. OR16]
MTQQEVTFRHLRSIEELEEMVNLLCEVWETDSPIDLTNVSTLRAEVAAENYVVGIFGSDSRMIAAGYAIRGKGHIHSHIVGVHPKHQGHGYGYELKQHEAKWARDEDYPCIRWTYDPLVRRNAYFNLAKLTCTVQSYEKNFYGEVKDGLNDNDVTDRLMVEWRFGDGEPIEVDAPEEADSWDFRRRPTALLRLSGDLALVPTPADIATLRRDDAARAREWRFGVRDGFIEAFDEGFTVSGFSPDGWYVLRRR